MSIEAHLTSANRPPHRIAGRLTRLITLLTLSTAFFTRTTTKAVVVLLGLADICWPGTVLDPRRPTPPAETIIAGYRQLIAQAHVHNVRIIGAALTPFEDALEGTRLGDYYNPEREAVREAVNRWIRTSGGFDAVIDFDAVLRDPIHPTRIRADYDSGDHLHPGDKGNEAMAEAIDLKALLGR